MWLLQVMDRDVCKVDLNHSHKRARRVDDTDKQKTRSGSNLLGHLYAGICISENGLVRHSFSRTHTRTGEREFARLYRLLGPRRKRAYLGHLVSHPFRKHMRAHRTSNPTTSNQNHRPSDQNHRNDRDHFTQPCVFRPYRKLHERAGSE